MYVITPNGPIYHIAKTETITLCGRSLVNSNSEHRKRKDDWRPSGEIPAKQVTGLCGECDRKVTGAPAPEPPPIELLRPPKWEDIIPYST